jgi:hypothetical protein
MYIEYVSKVFIHASLWKRILLYVSGILNWSWKAVEIWNVPFLNSYSSSFSTKPNDEFSVRTKMLKNACGMNMFNSEICTPWQGAVRVLQQGEGRMELTDSLWFLSRRNTGTAEQFPPSPCLLAYSIPAPSTYFVKRPVAWRFWKTRVAWAHSIQYSVLHTQTRQALHCCSTFTVPWCKVQTAENGKSQTGFGFLQEKLQLTGHPAFECLFAHREIFQFPTPYLVVLHFFSPPLASINVHACTRTTTGTKCHECCFRTCHYKLKTLVAWGHWIQTSLPNVHYSECHRIYI